MTLQNEPTASAHTATNTFRAQNGEDRWLDTYFGHNRNGFFVDIGAYNGVDLSNSYHFEQIGWTGVLVEPDPEHAAHCHAARPRSHSFHCAAVSSSEINEITFHRVQSAGVYSTTNLTPEHAQRLSGMGCALKPITVPARTLDSILEEIRTTMVDFVSIDVEGAELDVLQGFDIERWKPTIVVIESNSKSRPSAIRDYFVRYGYAYQHSIDVNDFYLRVGEGAATATRDALNYSRHQIRRRFTRLGQNLRRAWYKHVSGWKN